MTEFKNPKFRTVNNGKYPAMPPDHQTDPGLTLVPASMAERLWMSARRFGKISIEAGLVAFATTGSWSKAVIVGLGTGLTAGSFKLVKETRKAKGKTSWVDVVNAWLNAIGLTIKLIK